VLDSRRFLYWQAGIRALTAGLRRAPLWAAIGAWCVGVLAAPAPAAAGQAAEAAAVPLTLEQVIDEALARNPELAALAREYERARLVPDTARGFEPPSFEAQIWRWPIDTINPANTDMYMFSINQMLPGRGKRERRAAVAEADAAVAGASIAARARRIVDQVKQAWAELYLVRQAIETNTGTVALLRQFADIAATKYSTGRMSQQDVLASVVELSRLHEELVGLREREGLAAAMLNTLLDRAPERPVGPLADPIDLPALPPTADLQALALTHEPGLRVAGLEVERAEAALASAIADYKPDFGVSGGYMVMPNGTDAWTAGVSLTWPGAPWSRRRLDAEKAVAAADVSASEARRRAAENEVRLAVHQAWLRVASARERVALLGSSVLPQAEQAVDVARAGYESDRGSFLALIDSQRVLLAARLDYHRARAERAQAIADLERVVGIDLAGGAAPVPRFGGLER
jgi:outer membrane protein TolC